MKRDRAGHLEEGFSLLEALVSLVLLALILAALPSALRLGQRALSGAERWETTSIEVATTGFVFRTLSEAMPLREARADGLQAMTFNGDARTVTFIAPLAPPHRAAGLYRFTLAAQPSTSGPEYVQLTWQPYSAGASSAGGTETRRVMRGSPFRLRYWGKPDAKPPAWHERWIAATLPDAVEITYAAAQGQPIVRRITLKLDG